jgi:hypothetical protein
VPTAPPRHGWRMLGAVVARLAVATVVYFVSGLRLAVGGVIAGAAGVTYDAVTKRRS